MNYRHAYHAGNFSDVLKHATLALVIEYLKRKEAPFRVIDTHAGAGRYALDAPQAAKTGEWLAGIGRLIGADAKPLPGAIEPLLSPYLDAVRSENAGGQITVYPGSPLIARRLMRPQDVLVVNELHPEDSALLISAIGRDRRVKTMTLDGWIAVKSLLPPKERRGVVLMDPPFEEDGELERLANGLAEGLRRFGTGTFLAWYPIKDLKPIKRFHDILAASADRELLRVELMIRAPRVPERLNGCGLIVANPPFTLEGDLARLLPELTRRLAAEPGAKHRIDHIRTHERSRGSAPAILHRGKRERS